MPTEREIQEERENIARTVSQEQQKAKEEIKKGEKGIQSFNVPSVKLPRIEEPKLRLNFFNKGEVPPEYRKYLEWLEEQKKGQLPPVVRASKDAGEKVVSGGSVVKEAWDFLYGDGPKVVGPNGPIEGKK